MDRPFFRPLWQWLFLFTPSLEIFLNITLARWLGRMHRGPFFESVARALVLGTPLVFVLLCVTLGAWWRWKNSDWGERVAHGFFLGVAIAVANIALAVGVVARLAY